MGLDFVDIKFHIEREFDVEIPNREMGAELLRRIELAEASARKSGQRVRRDVSVQQLFDLVCNRIYYQHGRVPADAWPRYVRCIQTVLQVDASEIVPTA